MEYDIDSIRKQIRKGKTSPVSNKKRLEMAFGENKTKSNHPKDQNPPKTPRYNINIEPKYKQLNTENMEVVIPIRDDSEMNKRNGHSRTITKPNEKNIKKNHPKFFSPEATEILQSNKHIIIGEVGCGVCNNQKKIIDGEYLSLDVNMTAKTNSRGELIGVDIKPKSNWGNFKDTMPINEHTFKNLSNLEQVMAKKLPTVQGQLAQVKQKRDQIMANGNNKKDLAELKKQEDQLQSFVKDYNEVNKVKTQAEHLFKMNKVLVDPKIDYENTINQYKMVYVNSSDKREKKGASEISDMYDQEGYPMQVLDQCAVNSKNPKDLAKCKIEGMKSPMQLVSLDAQQRGDMAKVDYVKELQKKLRET